MTDYKIIQTINGPEDVKKLSMEQLEELASERISLYLMYLIRAILIRF